jgi:hypothetical protein
MLTEHQYDRLERWLLLCDKANERSSHQNAKFRKYLEAQTQRDIAREMALELPNDPVRQETLKVAVEKLDQAREQFAQTLGRIRRRKK